MRASRTTPAGCWRDHAAPRAVDGGQAEGAEAYDRGGRAVGRVVAVHNYGAGDILEVQGEGPSLLVPFTAAAVPEVDIAGGRLVLEPPGEVEPGAEEEGGVDPALAKE